MEGEWDECGTLVREEKRILALAIKWGGTTVHDFRGVDGAEGKFVQKLKIYGQKKCPACGTLVAKVVLGGRTSWHCPNPGGLRRRDVIRRFGIICLS